MKTSLLDGGKLLLSRDPEDRKPLLDRLNRIEGQVRGLKAMLEADRYCGDELQQIKAVIAALRRVAIIISEQHILAAAERLPDNRNRKAAATDIPHILGKALDI